MPLHVLDNLTNLTDLTTARLNIGLGTTDSPQFAGLTVTTNLSVTNSITTNSVAATEYDVTGTDGTIISSKDIRGWAFGSKATTTLSADNTPQAVDFKPDGSVMYVAGSTNRRIYSYNLSPSWDVSTASVTPTLFTVQLDAGIEGLAFSPDGKYLFTVSSSTDTVKRYLMSAGNEWNISTISVTPDKTFPLGTGVPRGLYFKPDGTRMYVFDDNTNLTTEYIMTAGNEWDISTATTGSSLLTIDATFGLAFSDNGKQLFFITATRIFEYTLPTAWVLTGGILTGQMFRATSDSSAIGGAIDPEAVSTDLYYNSTLNKCFFVGSQKDKVQEVIVVPQPAILGTRPIIIANPIGPNNNALNKINVNSLYITDSTDSSISPAAGAGALVVNGGIFAGGRINAGSEMSASLFGGTNVRMGTTGYIGFTSSSIMRSATNGIMTFTSFDQSTFNLMQLGPSSTTYPAIKRNGTGVDIVRADQTTAGSTAVFTDLRAQNITAFGSISATGAITTSGRLVASQPIGFPSFTVAGLTVLTGAPYVGAMAYVTDEVDGATMAFYDGTNWRRVQDRAIISTAP